MAYRRANTGCGCNNHAQTGQQRRRFIVGQQLYMHGGRIQKCAAVQLYTLQNTIGQKQLIHNNSHTIPDIHNYRHNKMIGHWQHPNHPVCRPKAQLFVGGSGTLHYRLMGEYHPFCSACSTRSEPHKNCVGQKWNSKIMCKAQCFIQVYSPMPPTDILTHLNSFAIGRLRR